MSTATCYSNKARNTRSRRQAAGLYATPAQTAAFAKRLREGTDALTKAELEALSQYKALTVSQRSRFAELAQAAA